MSVADNNANKTIDERPAGPRLGWRRRPRLLPLNSATDLLYLRWFTLRGGGSSPARESIDLVELF